MSYTKLRVGQARTQRKTKLESGIQGDPVDRSQQLHFNEGNGVIRSKYRYVKNDITIGITDVRHH